MRRKRRRKRKLKKLREKLEHANDLREKQRILDKIRRISPWHPLLDS
jgi:hypothetical protein